MKKTIFIIISLIILTAASTYAIKNYTQTNTLKNISTKNSLNNSQSNVESKLNQNVVKITAADFKLQDLNGNEVSLSNLKGKNVFLNFWASWCTPCKGEMPDIEKLYKQTVNSDLVIIAVNIQEKKDTVKNFISSNNYNFKVLLDEDGKVSEKYNISSIPTSFFIDKNGKIVDTKIGAMTFDEMKSYVDKLNK